MRRNTTPMSSADPETATPLPSGDWPPEGIEEIDDCPVCRSAVSSVLYENLSDRIFRCAPGRWRLLQCQGCGCAYLSPRPTVSTIGLAYSNYFTHGPLAEMETDGSGIKRFIRSLRNGYLN